MALYCQESYVDTTKNQRFGESEIYEAFTCKPGELYESLRKEYGRCVSKIYLDTKSKGTMSTGWVFQKRMPYEDAPDEFYVREVWVSLFEPCELDDPLALRRTTRLGEEVIRFKAKYLPA